VPPPPRHLEAEGKLAVLAEPDSDHAEHYRLLATNIELINLDRGAKSIVVTSPLSSDGKSVTSASLAVSFARRGYHVVLLEADVRRPTLGRLFDLGERAGLSDVALGRERLEDALAQVELPVVQKPSGRSDIRPSTNGPAAVEGRLEILLSGPPPPSPPDFLGSQAVAKIVAELTDRADLILIDTPPILHLSDVPAMLLGAEIDALITGVRIGRTDRHSIDELKRVLDSSPVVKLGFFVTGVREAPGYARYYGDGSTYAHRVGPRPLEAARRTVGRVRGR
jgi:Mrp family chromosome partitioning ATPase